jgi:oligopeptidase B
MTALAPALALLCWAAVPDQPATATASLTLTARIDPGAGRPPIAGKKPWERVVHGERLSDNYAWLRDKNDPEVRAYIAAENAYTDKIMKPTRALQEELFREMVGRLEQTDAALPYRQGDYLYYSRTEQGKQYRILCRKRGSLEGPEQVYLDLNELAQGRPYLLFHEQAISGDGRLLAYTTDVTGFREFTLRVKDLEANRHLPDRVEKVRSLAWSAGGDVLFYVKEDAAKRPYRVYRRVVGHPGGEDALVYEENDELFRVYIRPSADGRSILITPQSLTTTELLVVPSDRPTESPRLLIPRETGHEFDADHCGDRFYVRTNKDAPEFRLVSFPDDDSRPASWRELIAHRASITLEDFRLFAGHAVVFTREGGLPALRVVDLANGSEAPVELPDPVCYLYPDFNPDFNTTQFRFRYSSPIIPESIYELDLARHTIVLGKRSHVSGGFDPERYTVEWTHALARDGQKVPVSIVARKDVPRNGTAPLLLSGYGAYGAPMKLEFDLRRFSLLDRGVIYAQAHVRGGGDLGEHWQNSGRGLARDQSIADFIAVAEHLIARGDTAPDRLAVQGLSAGGVLIGAAVNRRPDLFRAVLLQGPFLDVVNSMLDPTLPLTVPEYLEWGDPRIKTQFDFMKSFCPYTNIRPQRYPAMLLLTTYDDSQVMYWEPVKYAAKLRAFKTDSNPLLLRVDSGTGHVGAEGRYDALRQKAFAYAFLLSQICPTRSPAAAAGPTLGSK